MKHPNIDAGEGYRLLSSGEILLEDDEFLTEENPDPPYQGREWLEVGYFEAGKHYGPGYAPVRRKIAK